MSKLLKSAVALACLCFLEKTYAQDVIQNEPGLYPSFVDFKANRPAFTNGKVFLTDEAGKVKSTDNASFKTKETDQVGMEHYRYQQSFAGIPVEHAVYIQHVQQGKVASQNGVWVKDFPANLKTTPSLSAKQALQKAMAYVGAQTYKWQIPAEEAFIKKEQNNAKATFYPTANLVFYSGENIVKPAQLRLAYTLDIYAQMPLSRQIVFVDAQNGNILGKREMIHTTNAAGTAVTAYSGTQSFTTDFTGSTYRLRETGRGNGINSYNMKNASTNYAAAVDFTDADNNWDNVNANKDQYATDAHWGTEKTYDFYLTRFNRNSVDNAGFALNSYIHTNLVAFGYGNNVNAFWDGTRMTYGDGDATYSPLTAIEIIGHEITHGVTERTSNLVYSNESGAMNEAFSDIFGTAIDFYARPGSANWLIGDAIGGAFRSMSNPNQYGDPDTYKGTNWYTGTADNGGVHTNSGVLNFWFYLLSVGGSGTNDLGTAYSVTGIGIDKAAAIAFRTNTVYLVSSSNYANARTFAIKSAEDLYGIGSAEATETGCAFAAVGIGTCGGVTPVTCNAPTGLATATITSNSATISWAAVSGAVSYKVEYKTSAATTWTIAASASTATSFALTGLSAATTYNWRVTTNCSSSTSTAATGSFTTLTSSTSCKSVYDTTTNGTRAGAATIPFNVNIAGLISPSADLDYYKFAITKAGTITITLGTLPGDYDLKLFNSAGTQVAISQNGSTSSETITYTAAVGTYYAQVYGYNNANSATVCYTLKVQLGTAGIFGFNSTEATAGKAILKTYPIPANNMLHVTALGLTGTQSKLTITNISGVVVLQQQLINNSLQVVNINKLPAGTYMLKVNNGTETINTKFVKQ